MYLVIHVAGERPHDILPNDIADFYAQLNQLTAAQAEFTITSGNWRDETHNPPQGSSER